MSKIVELRDDCVYTIFGGYVARPNVVIHLIWVTVILDNHSVPTIVCLHILNRNLLGTIGDFHSPVLSRSTRVPVRGGNWAVLRDHVLNGNVVGFCQSQVAGRNFHRIAPIAIPVNVSNDPIPNGHGLLRVVGPTFNSVSGRVVEIGSVDKEVATLNLQKCCAFRRIYGSKIPNSIQILDCHSISHNPDGVNCCPGYHGHRYV
mmetsp:Transcript_22252/g.89832  ORF Transcript_22252/g.89832 Transcript_22252/m.89832 type:complete len:203 (+) Transcript_22252:689-1297(+)